MRPELRDFNITLSPGVFLRAYEGLICEKQQRHVVCSVGWCGNLILFSSHIDKAISRYWRRSCPVRSILWVRIGPSSLLVSHISLGFVHPLQNVALHQCPPSSSVAFLFQVVPSFLAMSSCHLLLGRSLDPPLNPLLVATLCTYCTILAICPAHFYFCFSVYSIMPINFVLFLISEDGIL